MEVPPDDILSQLKNSVELIMHPLTAHAERSRAYQACEDFKENSPDCAQCGILMSSKDNSPIIRHFGLQLLEYAVRYKWNDLKSEEKLFIKDNTLKLMAEGTFDILTEEIHIKDGLSRIMVEIIKREWPQQYSNMFADYTELCKIGPTQTELVLLVFLRLAEDVLLFQMLPNQRRRDIMDGLSQNMSAIYCFFISTLKAHYENYQKNKTSLNETERKDMLSCCKVCRAVIDALSAYVDWISVSYIYQHEGGILLQMLCIMLSDENLQLPASECLLIIANRRGKLEDRKPLLILFSEDAMTAILNAAIAASKADLEEYHYLFFKKLCQVLTTLGTQLAIMWGVIIDGAVVGQPSTFSKYLEAILAFTQHPSQSLGSITLAMWSAFLRHEHISQNILLKDIFIPKLLETTRSSLLKVGFPSHENSRSCEYSRLDFETDEDFKSFFGNNDLHHCNLSSPSYLEWDAMSVFMESVQQKLSSNSSYMEQIPVENGIVMLKSVLQYTTEDPLLLSSQLSCISALFPFLSHAPDILPIILDKIFAAVVFNIKGQTKATRSRSVRNVRRHACSVLIKICKQYPHLLLPSFEQLYTHVTKLSNDPEILAQMEKTTIMEAIMLICNEFKNYDKHVLILGEILQNTKSLWFSEDMKQALWSPEKFLSFVGLDQAAVEDITSDNCGLHRSRILLCANSIYGTLKRTIWPSDPEIAKAGGYVLNSISTDNKISYRNPSTPHIMQMLENILALCRTLNQLWLPENQNKKHSDFEKAYNLMDIEKDQILGIAPRYVDNQESTSSKTASERMQGFVTTIYDTCYHILGSAGQCLGKEFYQTPNLAATLINTVFTNLNAVSSFRLKVFIRAFLKPFVTNCPKELHGSVVLPIMEAFGPFFLQRLTAEWQNAIQLDTSGDEEQIEQVLQDQVLRQISKEYIDLISHVFKDRSNINGSCQNAENAEELQIDDEQQNIKKNYPEILISEMGKLIIASDNVYPSLVMVVFSALTWPDTTVCNKCIPLTFPILKQLVTDQKLTGDDVSHVYTAVLQSLQLQGQHEGQQSMLLNLGLQVYEYLRPKYEELKSIMLQIPGVTENKIQVFDERLLHAANPQKQVPEKRKKEMYKKLIIEIIGKNVGQQFKKETKIRNLPPLLEKAKRHKATPVLDSETNDIGLCALFVSPDVDEL